MIYTESPRRKQITQQVAWGHWFAFANILMAIVISSVYLFSTAVADTPLSFVYMLSTWFGHISFISFLVFVVLVLPLCYQLKNMRVLRGTASVISAIALALLAFDALVYNNTGFHISFSSAELLRSETQVQVGAFSWLQWFYLCLLFIIWLMFQLVVANAIYQRMDRLQKLHISRYITTFFVLCFMASHAIHVWADAKLYTPVLKQDNMFPLSYPATAKTLMARYGLLDLEVRQQREELQIQGVSNRFVYPPKNVFCSVDAQQKVVLLASNQAINPADVSALTPNKFHLNTQSDPSRFFTQLQYGIPYNLVTRTSAPPVIIDLLNAFNVNSTRFVESSLVSAYEGAISEDASADLAEDDDANTQTSTQLSDKQQAWNSFQQSLNTTDSGLFYALVSAEQINQLNFTSISNGASVLLVAKDAQDGMYKLFSNFTDSTQASTNEDIAPTIARQFGCLADVYRFSTGQALQNPTRDWLVSTMGDNIVYFKSPFLTQVAIDGSYEVIDVNDQSEVLIDIDTNMLSRSIKHLENFSQ
ncbi:DUF3413 domain-containing protein [Ningiella sp. W23]|uniref:DUF3413 domain-containing protein n=1 Tax=Ningiella sp. W23 TaxID=3023715 RepID=UPI003756FD33